MNEKPIIPAIIIGITIIIAGIMFSLRPTSTSSLRGATFSPTFGATGTTVATSTVNTTSTQVIAAGWSEYARIQNPSTSTISCTLDNKTAASSSAASNLGVIIGSGAVVTNTTASSTVSPTIPSAVCFGALPGCIPYVGAINCVANVAATVTTIKN